MFAESQSAVFYQVLKIKCSSIMVCLKKMLNGELLLKKDTEKIVLLKVKGLIHIVKIRSKKNRTFLSSTTSLQIRAVAPNIATG